MGKRYSQVFKALIFVAAVVIVSILIVKIPSLLWKNGVKKSGSEVIAPQFSVSSLNYPGKVLSLKNYRGKIVLVNFWATWCPPCRHEMPELEKFYKLHKKDGFVIIGLSVNNQGVKYVRHFVKTFKAGMITYPIGMANHKIENDYGNIYEIPQSFFINKKGYVVAHFTGELPPGYLSYEFNKINKKS